MKAVARRQIYCLLGYLIATGVALGLGDQRDGGSPDGDRSKYAIGFDGREFGLWVPHTFSIKPQESIFDVIKRGCGYGPDEVRSIIATKTSDDFSGEMVVWVDGQIVERYDVAKNVVLKRLPADGSSAAALASISVGFSDSECDLKVAHAFQVEKGERFRKVLEMGTGMKSDQVRFLIPDRYAHGFSGSLTIWIGEKRMGSYEVANDIVVRLDDPKH